MKGKIEDTLLAVVSLILAFSVLFSVSAYAEQSISVDNLSNKSYNENEQTKNIAVQSVNSVKPEAKWDYVKVKFPFILVPLHSEPVYFLKNIGWLWIGTEVKVLDYYGDFTYVEVRKTREKGYILSAFLDDNSSGDLELVIDSSRVWVGRETEIKVDYTGSDDIEWQISNTELASYTRTANGIKLKALKSGVVTVTASAGNLSENFKITCINKWQEHESSRTEKSVEVKKFPFDSSESIQTLEEGSLVEAMGDMGINSGWIFINTEDGIRGFIKLSEFPGIDYIMHQYHYYDIGYDLRFGSPRDRIFDYAAVTNRHMLRMFNLKVCPYVSSYTSIADECKIAQFGNVTTETLANACPKNEGHKTTSCLHRDVVFGDLKKQYGNGERLCPKIGWTGHILLDNARSAYSHPLLMIIMTPYSVVDSNYDNESDFEIKIETSATLMHETVHHFGVRDHYCYNNDPNQTEKCQNPGCFKCKGDGHEPDCMMMDTKYPTLTDDLLCEACQIKIKAYLSN